MILPYASGRVVTGDIISGGCEMQKIAPRLWFDTQTEEAVVYDVPVFGNSRIKQITHCGASGASVSDCGS